MIRSQDLVFTLYGDYIRHRGGEVWVGSLIELLGTLGVSEQAVRSALSRMSRKGWLKARRIGNKSYYALTPRAVKLLTEGAQRIFEPPQAGAWDGRWHILIYSIPEDKRHLRNRLRNELTWMGFGALSNGMWISPYDLRQEVAQLVDSLAIAQYVELFSGARHISLGDGQELVKRCWDLEGLNQHYAEFIGKYQPRFEDDTRRLEEDGTLEPSECFVQRFMLIHEYRQFPFIDPHLPRDLLPEDWLADEATQLFQDYHRLLTDGANQFVDSVFVAAP